MLGGLVIVAALIAVVLAGSATAHRCKGAHASRCAGEAGTPTFKITVSGDLGGNVTTTQAQGPESGIHNNPPVGEDLELDMAGFIGHNDGTEWNTCFDDGSGGNQFSGSTVQVAADKDDPGTGRAGFFFTANGTDGTEVKYHLAVTPVEIPQPALPAVWPNWLPDIVGQTVTVTTVTDGAWELQHSNGPGRKVACTVNGTTGEGTGETLHFTIAIKRIS